MSKLKLMYDIITKLKEKEEIAGNFQAQVKKDDQTLLDFSNEFRKNLNSGAVNFKIRTELDCGGKKVKHESQTQLEGQDWGEHKHGGFWRHMHHGQHHHGFRPEHGQDLAGPRRGGMKDRLTKVAFVLDSLNRISLEEQEDKSVVVSLRLDDFPADFKEAFRGKFAHQPMGGEHGQHNVLKDIHTWQDPALEFRAWISSGKEVEKITLTVAGKHLDEQNESHAMSIAAELHLLRP